MIVEVKKILASLMWPSNYMIENYCLKLGPSFTEDPELREIIDLISGGNKKELPNRLKSENIQGPEMDFVTKFKLFVILLNNYYNSSTNRLFDGFENTIEKLVADLEIDQKTMDQVMAFYINHLPYTDKKDCIYIAFEKASQLIKSSGVNVQFKSKQPDEIIYLKYFKEHDLFLAKTFKFTHANNPSPEDTKIKEINFITEKQYSSLEYAISSFDELKNEVENITPLQYVEVAETRSTPKIILNPGKSVISISGPSIPLSPNSYFEAILEWLSIFELTAKKKLEFHFNFNYFNTYTSKFLINTVRQCNHLTNNGKDISLFWYYDIEDDEMREFGEFLQAEYVVKDRIHLLAKDNIVNL